ncbi:MAG: hypothetical protein LBS93_07790 [Synergistaceae bacterium]|nr:hypothetical protein [Synergistaceae bacterium]
MKHLFIVNPLAGDIKGHAGEVVERIETFLSSHSHLRADIHVTRWKRDAVGYVRRYIQDAGEFVRVYAVGGTSTLFEVINGAIGLPNAQVANCPMGRCNSFVRSFGEKNIYLFRSLRNLVFSNTVPVDAIRCGYNYSVSFSTIGSESISGLNGEAIMDLFGYNSDIFYRLAALCNLLKPDAGTSYKITLDGTTLDGDYISMLIANQPCYGIGLKPAVDAIPNDGLLDLYLVRRTSRLQRARMMHDYTHGRYGRWPRYIAHHAGKRLSISSGEVMSICTDGERSYNTSIEFEIVPYAVDFVSPKGVRHETDNGDD